MKRPWPGRDRLGLDLSGLIQAIGGLVLGLIALFSSYDHISIAGRSLPIQQQWSIPCIAASVAIVLIDSQLATGSRLRAAHERETEIAILRERQKRLQIEKQIEQIDERTKQIENETEQLRRENARLAKLNARDDALSALIKQHCFPPESSSSPPKSTETDCGPSSP